jgi:hypothetical protein
MNAFRPLTFALLLAAACSSSADLGKNQNDAGPIDPNAGDAGPDLSRLRMFATKAAYNGDLRSAGRKLTGLDGADALCQSAADGAQLGGTFIAFISDERTDVRDRVLDEGPWYLVDRTTLVFASKNAISAAPANRIEMDESGGKPTDYVGGVDQFGNVWSQQGVALYWTGGSGMHTDTCGDWTVSNGVPSEGAVSTSDLGTFPNSFCDHQHRLLCIEQRTKPAALPTKHVFLTSKSFAGDLVTQTGAADGLLAGDQLCQAAAMNAGRAGTYKAWLSGKDASGKRVKAADRILDAQYMLFDDKTLVFSRHADLLIAPLNPIDQDENGGHLQFSAAWTGTEDGSVPSADNCNDWKSSSRDFAGMTGTVTDVTLWTNERRPSDCFQQEGLYCFEQ